MKRDSVTFDELCTRWLDSRHDIREVTRLGYGYVLKTVRGAVRAGRKVQDLNRADIENMIKSSWSGGTVHVPSSTRSALSGRCSRTGSAKIAVGQRRCLESSTQNSTAKPWPTQGPKNEPWTREELLPLPGRRRS